MFGEATKLAAEAYQSDHTLFGVNGTSGNNFIVIRALQEQMNGELNILSSRNVHMSIVNAAYDYGARLEFIQPNVDDEIQMFLPNSADEILDHMDRVRPNVLLLSNPTYEGASVDLEAIIPQVRENFPDTIIFVDEAWGAHFPFSDELPVSAMQAGADICSQSTHKQGNALQQSSMIHWRDGRVDEETLRRSYRSLSTTSPSFHLLAGMDASREFMQTRGSAEIGKLLELSSDFTELLRAIGHCSVHSFDDPTKLLLHFPDRSAPAIAGKLEEQGIIAEKAETHNMLLIVGFQNDLDQAARTAEAIEKAADSLPEVTSVMPPFSVMTEKGDGIGNPVFLPVSEAIGKTCLEHVIPYPPGIPVLTKGERVTDAHVTYLLAAFTNSHIDVMVSREHHILIAE